LLEAVESFLEVADEAGLCCVNEALWLSDIDLLVKDGLKEGVVDLVDLETHQDGICEEEVQILQA
jgi:predicted nucleotidyltransferase